MAEKVAERPGNGSGDPLGLGLDPEASKAVIETIGTIFGLQMMNDMRDEDREMFPEEGTQ